MIQNFHHVKLQCDWNYHSCNLVKRHLTICFSLSRSYFLQLFSIALSFSFTITYFLPFPTFSVTISTPLCHTYLFSYCIPSPLNCSLFFSSNFFLSKLFFYLSHFTLLLMQIISHYIFLHKIIFSFPRNNFSFVL